jgi:tyrosine-protein phosphatase SIW14
MTRLLLPTTALLTLLAAAAPAPAQSADGESWLHPTPVAPGLWRGRAPYRHRHYEELQRLGVRTILDMRGNQPFASAIERRRAAAHGFVYRKVPMGFRPLRDHSDERVLAALQNVADYPMYVHCNIDRDRTSVAIAAYRVRVQGWSPAAAQAEAYSFGLRWYFVGLNRYLRALGR